MTSSGHGGVPSFNEILKMQQRQEQKICDRVIACLKSGQIPTPDDIRMDINGLVSRREEVLRYHPYWKERQLRLGLESLIRAAHQGYVDICRHDAALGSLAKATGFEKHIDHAIGYAAQKDVVAYGSLVSGVLDTLRRLESKRPDIAGEIRHVADDHFDDDVTLIVKDLRNNLSHGSVVIPKWKISIVPKAFIGSMMYPKEELLAFGEWCSRSKRYIGNAEGDSINIAQVVGEHFHLLNKFDQSIQGLFARNVTPAEKDFFYIEDSHKRDARRQWILILVAQIGKGKDPYDYLHYYFDPEGVREILRLPKHSKEQVDFMIELKGAEIDCNEELRNKLYCVFGVENDSPNRS